MLRQPLPVFLRCSLRITRQCMTMIELATRPHLILPASPCRPVPGESRRRRSPIRASPVFTDHMVRATGTGRGWHSATWPRAAVTLDPAAAVCTCAGNLRGHKAYASPRGMRCSPENARRFNASARRLAMPNLRRRFAKPAQLVLADRDGSDGEGGSLYLGRSVRRGAVLAWPARQYKFLLSRRAGNYFKSGNNAVRSVWAIHPRAQGAPAPPSAAAIMPPVWCRKPRRSHAGTTRFVAVFRTTRAQVGRELGGMNVFFAFEDGTLVTPPLSGRPPRHHS